MKKAFMWIGGILLSPVLLFLVLTGLLYVPAIQNWVVDKVASVASEQTGMQISVGHIDLVFPLDLGVDGVTVVHESGDTIACIGRATVDVGLWPLLKKEVEVKQLALDKTRLNTLDLVPDLQVSGWLDHLSVGATGIDIDAGTVALSSAQLADADLLIELSDTAAVDTTTSEVPWLISMDSIAVRRARIELHMPGDSMHIMVYMDLAKAEEVLVDLDKAVYTVHSFDYRNGEVTYDLPKEPRLPAGLDYSHIALSGVNCGIDSVFFAAPQLSLKIRDASLREQSGLELTQMTGKMLMDSAGIRLPSMALATPYSNIYARAEADFNVMDSINPGKLFLDLKAELGKQDLMLFMADMPKTFQTRWPDWPLRLNCKMNGNMQRAHIWNAEAELPTAFSLSASGDVENLTDLPRLLAQLDVKANTYDLGFATTLLDPELMKQYRIPKNISLTGNIDVNANRYAARLVAREGSGVVKLNGSATLHPQTQDVMGYRLVADVNNLNLHHFMPKDSIYTLTASAHVSGYGTDFFSKRSRLQAEAHVAHLGYGSYNIDSLTLTAQLQDSHATAGLISNNALLQGTVNVDALLENMADIKARKKREYIRATVVANIQKVDFEALQFVDRPLSMGLCGHIDLESNLNDLYKADGMIGDLYIKDSLQTFRPEDVGLSLLTRLDTTLLRLQSGDFVMKADASGGYEQLLNSFMALADTTMTQLHQRIIDQPAIKRQLPTARFYLTSGRNNPIANFLRSSVDTYFKSLVVDMTTSPVAGINGDAHVFGLNADSIRIDTIALHLKDTERGLTYQGRVVNNRRNPQFVFSALLDGKVHEKGALAGLRYYDHRGQMGLRIGMTADMVAEGIMLKLMPERPTIGYKEFNLNKDNFLLLNKNMRIEAKVDLIADDGTGVKIYSESQDSTLLQDLTVSLHKFDLEQLTSVLPYVVPQISGILGGDYHLIMDHQQHISVASDMQIERLAYEKSPIGTLGTEFVYLQREDDTHAIEGQLQLDGRDIAAISGEYKNTGKGNLSADIQLTRFPLMMANGFVPDQLIGLEGYAEGEVKIEGALDAPIVNGELMLDSAFLVSKPYGMNLRFDNDPVRFENSKLLFENFNMYAHNNNPLVIMGNIDFHDLDRMTVDMRMQARNFQLINSKQTRGSIAYGKAFVNFFARMNGRVDQLQMRGKLDVLGTTDVTYLLLDSPLSTDNQLDELVRFTDFSDSTQTVVQKPTPQGLNVDMTVSVDEGTHVLCGLNADQSNYVDLYGGGDLYMKYTGDEISLRGRYTLSSGRMKYSLPVIPLKTFTIQDGSYVEFTGNMMNPTMNITATERTKASVSSEEGQSRNVAFDCGVTITRTLQNLGLEFIIDAPEDNSISNDLNSMTTEERGKVAVTMLTTGMYLADGNTSGFSMNNALSSFLQSEINTITGNALNSVDLSVGLDNTTDATGETHTDYSFKFAKRFWNNRLSVQIGGKVSTGSEAQQAGQTGQSFFDNVTMEYRITPTSNQYLKLFYNQNVYDWLEGYTGQYGVGYLWRRKLSSFRDIFHIWGNSKESDRAFPTTTRRSERTDTIKPNNNEK